MMDAANTERNIILGYMAMCGYQYKWAKPNICSGLWQCFKQCVRSKPSDLLVLQIYQFIRYLIGSYDCR